MNRTNTISLIILSLISVMNLAGQDILRMPRNGGFTTQTGKQTQTYTLRCRGGSTESFPISASYPLAGDRDQNTAVLFLRFQKSGSTENLSPGGCSWLDRVINAQEPNEVRFTASPAVIRNIVDKIADSKVYIDFSSYNSNQGYFLATGQKIWESPNISSKSSEIRRRDRMPEVFEVQKITRVAVTPSTNSARISFQTSYPARTLVEVSTRRPIGLFFDRRFVVASQTVDTGGGSRSAIVEMPGLKSGTKYFFILSVVGGTGKNDVTVRYLDEFLTQVRID